MAPAQAEEEVIPRALILTADNFEDSELLYPYYRLLEEGINVDIAAPSEGTVTGKYGYSMSVNLTFEEVNADDYTILVLPGGEAPAAIREDETVLEITRAMVEDGKVVAAICHGPQVLISAGVMEGRKATCWRGVQAELEEAGAEYENRAVVVDGNIITSRHPGDLPMFSREMFRAIRGQ